MDKSPAWRLSVQAWLGLLALALVIWATMVNIDLILEVIWIVFGTFLLSLAIQPVADFLTRWRIPRGVTVIVVYLGAIGILFALGVLLVPVINAEIDLFQTRGPALLQTALSRLTTLPLVGHIPSLTTLTQNLANYIAGLLPTLFSTLASVGEITVDLFVVLILTYFLVTDTAIGQHLLANWAPRQYQTEVSTVMGRLRFRLTRWVWAQLAIMLYFALTFGLGLFLLGVPFALTIALVGGILEIIPYVGGITATLLGVLSAVTVDPWLALLVVLLYTIVAEVQSHFIAPNFYGRAIDLHPGLILLTLLIGVKIRGIIGVFFAVPVTVVLITFLQEVRAILRNQDNSIITTDPPAAMKEQASHHLDDSN